MKLWILKLSWQHVVCTTRPHLLHPITPVRRHPLTRSDRSGGLCTAAHTSHVLATRSVRSHTHHSSTSTTTSISSGGGGRQWQHVPNQPTAACTPPHELAAGAGSQWCCCRGQAAGMAASSTAPAATTFKVEVKRWHAVGVWTWDAGDDLCGICRNPFDGCPPDAKFPGDDSPVVWGTCGHAFHLQCIQKWLASQAEQRCPMCRQLWEFKAASAERQTR